MLYLEGHLSLPDKFGCEVSLSIWGSADQIIVEIMEYTELEGMPGSSDICVLCA